MKEKEQLCTYYKWSKVLEILGSGASGNVRKVKYRNKYYAIKVSVITNKMFEGYIKNSIKIINLLKRKKFPGLITYYGHKFCKDPLFQPIKILVQSMDYYPYTLRKFVESNKPGVKWWYTFIDRVLELIDLLVSSYKIIHGDLSMDNIMITANGEPKFTDWDFSYKIKKDDDLNVDKNRFLLDITGDNEVMGKDPYYDLIPDEIKVYARKKLDNH